MEPAGTSSASLVQQFPETMECEEDYDLKEDLTQSLKELLRDKLKEETNVDVDCLLCISQRNTGEEFTIKIHDLLFPTEISTITENSYVGVQVENEGDDSQVQAGEYENNVSLEDTLSKGVPEIPSKDCDNLSDTTAVGSSRSGSPEDPAEQVIENKSEGHPEEEADQIENVQGTRKDDNHFENASREFGGLQKRNVLNGVDVCNSTVADSSHVADPIQDVNKTPLDTGDCVKESVQKKDQGQFEEHDEKGPSPEIIQEDKEDENPFEDLSQEFDDAQDNEVKIDDTQHEDTRLTNDKVENPVENEDQGQFVEHNEKGPSPEIIQEEDKEEENPFEDLSQEFDDFHDTEPKVPYDIQNNEIHLTNDKVDQAAEEENIFESDVQMAKLVSPSDERFECRIRAVEGQFDDISDESQVEETEMVKFGSVIPLEDEVTSTKDTANIDMTSEAMEEIIQDSVQRDALHDDGTNLNIENVMSVYSEEHANIIQDSLQRNLLQSDGSNLNIENVVNVHSEERPEISEETTGGTGMRDMHSVQKDTIAYSLQPTEVNISQSETVANDGDSDDIVVIEDDEEEIGNNVADESQPPIATQQQQEDEDDVQMTWEKRPSPRKRSYPFNEPVGSSSTVSAGSNVDMRAGRYNDFAAGYNVNMNCTSTADRGNAGRTNPTQRALPMPNYADGCNVVQRSTSQITMNSNFNQRPTGEVTSIDSAEFKCGICNFTSNVYVELSIHLERQHRFEIFLSCVLCHEYFPNRGTFTIHRKMKHPDKDYFRCPHCGNGFGTEECMYHRQECKAQQFSQPATNTGYNAPRLPSVRSGTIQNVQSRQLSAQNTSPRQTVTNALTAYPSGYLGGRGGSFQNTQARQAPNRNLQGTGVYPAGRQAVSQNIYQTTNVSSSRSRSLPTTGIARNISSAGQLSGIQIQNRQQQQIIGGTLRNIHSAGQSSGIQMQNRQQQQQQAVGGTVRNIHSNGQLSGIQMQNRQQQQQTVGGTVRNVSSVGQLSGMQMQNRQQQTMIVRNISGPGQLSGIQLQNQQQQQSQPRHQSPIKVARFSSVPARSVLSSPVILPTSARPQSAPPRRKLDRSIQYICDQCNTSLPSLKEYETHCLNAHNRYVCPVCSGSFPSRKLADKHLSQHSV